VGFNVTFEKKIIIHEIEHDISVTQRDAPIAIGGVPCEIPPAGRQAV